MRQDDSAVVLRADDAFPGKCPNCGRDLAIPDEIDEDITQQAIYRRHRRKHFHWSGEGEYDPDDDPLLSQNAGADIDENEDLNEDCNIATQYFEVEFRDEYKQCVVVEASTEHEAEEIGDMERDPMMAEPVQTLHTEVREVGEPSQASIEYLERVGLLPADHDVTEEDIKKLADEQWENSDEERDA